MLQAYLLLELLCSALLAETGRKCPLVFEISTALSRIGQDIFLVLRASFRIGKTEEDDTKVFSAETLKTQIDFMAYKIKAEVCFENLGRV